MDSTLALGALRIARDAGGEAVREREPRRAGEGRLVWNRNSCVLIDYGLWAAKSEGRPWVDQCLDHHLNLHLYLHLYLGVGCAPSCWLIFGFRNLLGARRGAEGSFLCSLSSMAEGAGWEASPGRGGELGCQAKKVIAALEFELKLLDQVEVSAVWIPHWHSEPFESQGARAAKRWT